MQRVLDIFCSFFALLILSPFLFIISMLLSCTGEGEIFFSQLRIGRNGERFKLWKFATMLKDSPNIGTGTVTVTDDYRVLRVGKILRKTKANELPQLFNVLVGDMSLVGPRPQAPQCYELFSQDVQKLIVTVRPGLSGVGSIVFRNEEELLTDKTGSINFYRNVIAAYKGEVEAAYVSRQSILLYLSVIFVTIWTTLCPSSAIFWRVFNWVPEPPDSLKGPLRFNRKIEKKRYFSF